MKKFNISFSASFSVPFLTPLLVPFFTSVVVFTAMFALTSLSIKTVSADGFSGTGTGVENDPYVITSCAQLQEMNMDLAAHYELANSIDCSATASSSPNVDEWVEGVVGGDLIPDSYASTTQTDIIINNNGYYGFSPVGDGSTPFTGTLDGNGYTISNIWIFRKTQPNVGIFGYTNGATISNLNITNSNIVGGEGTGALVGQIEAGTVSNISLINNMVRTYLAYRGGGLTGRLGTGAVATNITNTGGTVHGSGNVIGGLVGYMSDATLQNSSSSANVDGGYNIGGAIGEMNNATSTNVHVSGNVDAHRSEYVVMKTGYYSGGFVGYMSQSYIASSSASGDVATTGEYSGGFAGYTYLVNIVNSSSTGDVTASVFTNEVPQTFTPIYIGGFVGQASGSSVFTGASSAGNVTGVGSYTGGFAGYSGCQTVFTRSFATGNVNSVGDYTGGFVGAASCGQPSITFSQTFSSGNVTGSNYTGGFAGSITRSVVTNAYASSTVLGNNYTGGFAGNITGGSTSKVYARTTTSSTGDTSIGAFAGYFDSSNNVSNSFWNTNLTNPALGCSDGSSCIGVTGTSTSVMTISPTFVNAGYNFQNIWGMGGDNDGYPFFQYQGFTNTVEPGALSGTGVQGDPYVITTCTQLQQIDQNLNAYYVLGNDVDCSVTNPGNPNNAASQWNDGRGFKPIGTVANTIYNIVYSNFTGNFDGQNHKILNLYINRGSNQNDINGYYIGLFATIGNGASVENLGLENVNIYGSGNSIGALAGGLSGTVTNVYSTGTVEGNGQVGGLVGVHVDSNNFPNSSPLVYTWNGEKYTYTVDVGGFLPKELNGVDIAQIDSKDIAPKDGKYSMKITEEYNEIVYYDELALMIFDHQPGYTVVQPLKRDANVNDLRTVKDTPTNELVSCVDDQGKNCTDALRAYDDKWSYRNENGSFNTKNLKKYWILDFGDLSNASNTAQLVMRGARNYEASATYPGNSARSVQVKDANGNWVEIYNKNQLDSDGSPRLRTLDLAGKFLSNDYRVKVAFDTFNANYFAVDTSTQVPFTSHTYHPDSANLGFYGFSAIDRTYFMDHDYSKVAPAPEKPFKNQYGKFTKYGDVTPLLSAGDDQPVIMRYGDQMSIEFPYVAPAPGMKRSFMLYNDVLYKHATYEASGALSQSADYLPYKGMTKYSADMTPYPMTESNTNYINTWNTRVYPGPFPDALRAGGSTIINSYSTASVYGSWTVGGLVGLNQKEIRRSYATGSVEGDSYIGGLVGQNTNSGVLGWIRDSYATGNVSGNSIAGGLAGYNNSIIEKSFSTGSVTNTGFYAGGLVGINYQATEGSGIFNSFTTSEVAANLSNNTGGFVGYGYYQDYAINGNYWFNSLTAGDGYDQSVPPPKVVNAEYFQLNNSNAPLTSWDFSTIWSSTSGVNNNYPYLRWQSVASTSTYDVPPSQPINTFTSGSRTGGGSTVGSWGSSMGASVRNAFAAISASKSTATTTIRAQVASNAPKTPSTFKFTRTLRRGMVGDDVKELQKLLNANGFPIALTGLGSKGNETTRFGIATQSALIKFQKANKITPAIGMFGPVTRGVLK